MIGKTCIVTGATNGIGKETALGLAQMGAHVVIMGRDTIRLQNAEEWIKKKTGSQQISSLASDFSSLKNVRLAAEEVNQRFGRLDVLVNNAGAIFSDRALTVDGIERTWALNHLAYFLFTLSLLDLIKASAPARIINVASNAHFRGKLDFDNLQGEREYQDFPIYSQSKLANVLFTYALARRLGRSGVTANCLHPGVVATGFGQSNRSWFSFLLFLFRPLMKSAKKGARTSIFLASSPDLEKINGEYFSECTKKESALGSRDVGIQEKLWEISLGQLGQFKGSLNEFRN